MQETHEVNASLFREVRYGEVVTIDPMKWVMEQFSSGTQREPPETFDSGRVLKQSNRREEQK